MTARSEKPILKNKTYLYLTEFFAGMSVMAVELGASRLLAPYFSSSQIVWTIIIGTIMIALSLGNYWGGRAADRDPDPDKLYRRILIAAVWIAAIPVVGKYIILLVGGALVLTVSTNFLVIAAFLSCGILFVYPLFLLGTVTPSLVKYSVASLDESGSVVGTLGACNTVGSIIGTFLPTFVTIPAVGTAITFLIFSGILLTLGLIYFLSGRTGRKICTVAVIAFTVCSVLGQSGSAAFWETNLAYEGESIYNYLQVKDYSDSTVLSTNVLFGVQSIKMKQDGLTGMYYDYALAAPVMAGVAGKSDADILILGNGTGTYATQCGKYFPKARVEGVEIDGRITDLARTYFDLPASEKVTTYDGRTFLQNTGTQYDVILVDAYRDITIPFQMASREFFTLAKSHLKPGGVMVVNLNMTADGEDGINTALCDTIGSVFPSVATVDVGGSGNREVFAADGVNLEQALATGNAAPSSPDLASLMDTVSARLTAYTPGKQVMTDDRAPVEVLGMRMLDASIATELGYYKEIFRTQGFQGLLDQ